MVLLFKTLLWILFINVINSVRIVGNIINKNKQNNQCGINAINAMNNINNLVTEDIKTFCMNINQQNIIANKNNLIYCEKDKELFLEDNNFIKDKKLISISPGGLKGFYELGILSYIKDNYDMEKYIYSGASAGAWNALFMCYKYDSKKFVFNLLDYKLSQIKSIKNLEYYLKYKLITSYKAEDFDLRRLFIGVTTVKNFKLATNIFSDFNSLEDAINCCIASSHIPLISGGLTNRYHNMYTFDGGFSSYPYLNFTENVLHITPGMWKKLNDKKSIENINENINKKSLVNSLSSLNILYEIFLMLRNSNYMELFDNGYSDAKINKELLDKIFLTIPEVTTTINRPFQNLDLDLSKDNDSY
jgi:hypothetical protein